MFFGIQYKDVSFEVPFMFLAVCIKRLNYEVTEVRSWYHVSFVC